MRVAKRVRGRVLRRPTGDPVHDPDQMPLGDRGDVGIDEHRISLVPGRLADLDDRPLRPHPLVPRRMVELLELGLERVGVLAPRPGRDGRAFVGDGVDPSDLLGLRAPRAHAPVGDVHGLAVVGQADVERAELARVAGRHEVDLVLDLEGGAGGLEGEPLDLLLAPLGPEDAVPVLLGPGVFLVDHSSARGAAAVLGDPVEEAVGVVVVVVGIAVIAAVDVVGHSGPPAVAVVGVVVGEEVVAVVEVRLQVVPRAVGQHLDLGPVGLAAERPAADDLRGLAVGAGGLQDALVAGGDIKVIVDPELDSRDDVVVQAPVVGDP